MSTKNNIFSKIIEDAKENKNNTRGAIIVILYRVANQYYEANSPKKYLYFPFKIIYTILVQYIMCVDIPAKVKIGSKLRIYHGFGIVIHPRCVLGDNIVLRHNVTIGENRMGEGVPKIMNNVEFGCNSIVVGDIVVNNNTKIGAGSFVSKNVPANSIVIGSRSKSK